MIVETIRSPGNLGSILRTAEACGAGGLILVDDHCDPFDPAVVRAAMGALSHQRFVRATLAQLGEWVRRTGMHVVGLSPEAKPLWTEMPEVKPLGLVLGEERQGISPPLRSLCQTTVRLPVMGHVDSLNVAVAAGVALYELMRRSADATRASPV